MRDLRKDLEQKTPKEKVERLKSWWNPMEPEEKAYLLAKLMHPQMGKRER